MSDAGVPVGRRAFRLLLVFLTVSFYATVAPFGYALFAAFAWLPAREQGRRVRVVQGVVRWAFAGLHHWMRWVRFVDYDPRSLKGAVPDGPCVIVANHPSLTDTTAIVGSVPDVCTAVRSDLYRKFWLSPLLVGAGHFDAGGRGVWAISTMIDNAQKRLMEGFRVLVFPEGTRSPRGGPMRPFGRAPFEIASRANVRVVAILIEEEPAWLAPGDRLFGPPMYVAEKRLSVLEILSPADFSGDSRKMREYVEALYREALGLSAPAASAK